MRRGLLAVSILLALGSLGGAAPALASTHVWGGGAGGAWSNGANWTNGVPTSGESGGTIVQFGSNTSSDMDLSNLTVDRISFTGSGNTIVSSLGKTLSISSATLANNIDSASTGNKTTSALTLKPVGTAAVFVRSGSGQLTIDSPITGSAPITFSVVAGSPAGTGTTLTGTSNFTGKTTVASGVLTLDNSDLSKAITGSALEIGTGSGTGATVQLLQFFEIADTTDISVKSDGVLDMGGAGDTVGSLAIDQGLVENISGSSPGLTIVGGLSMTGGTINAGGPLTVGGDVSATSVSAAPATIKTALAVSGGAFDVSDGPNAVDLDLSAADQQLSGLSVSGGTVQLGSRKLTLGAGLTMVGGKVTGTSSAQLVLGGNVTATSTATGASIDVALALAGARTLTVNDGAAAEDLTLGGNISDGSATGSITKTGAGTVLMQPPSGSLYTGGTTVKDGVLEINSPVTASIPSGGLTIGDGVGSADSAVVKTLAVADITTGTTVNRDGLLDMGSHGQNLPALAVNDGEVRIGTSSLFVSALSMTGGTLNGTGTLSMPVPTNTPSVSVTSSASGPAHLAYTGNTFINASTTLTVTPGPVAPEFVSEKFVQMQSAAHLIKQGAGTAQFKGTSPKLGVVDVQAGTFGVADFFAPKFTVSPGATLTGKGTIGPAVVNGSLAPSSPKLTVAGDLAFGASGRLRVAVPSAVAAEAPFVQVNGAVNIDPGAALDLGIANGVTLPAGTKLPLITNDAADAVTGQFGNAPAGQFTESGGRSLTLSYAGGDGNDLDATVDAVQQAPAPPTRHPR